MSTVEYTDEELFNYLKELPEFGNLALPESWYKKFNIPLLKPDNFKEVVESNYVLKASLNTGGFIELPTPKDYVFPELKSEDIPLEVETKPLDNVVIVSE
jgi:hypothetical protein